MKAVILAAGKGTRMRGLSNNAPKPLLPIANRPIVSLILERIRSMQIEEVAMVIGYKGEMIREHVGDGSRYGTQVQYVWQEEQLGTGHAALLCEEFIGDDSFVLIFGDILARGDNYPAMAEMARQKDVDGVLTVFPVEDPSGGAAVEVENGRVKQIIEKPEPGSARNAYNNAGIFVWPAGIIEELHHVELSPRGEYEFTDAILAWMDKGKHIAALELRGYWDNITDPEASIRMNQNVLADLLPPDEQGIDEGARIDDGAEATGSRIAAGAHIGSGTRIEDSVIGRDAVIGANVTAHAAEVAPGARVGAGCKLGAHVSIAEGAVIEPGCAIGPNTSIGRNVRVGSGATVTSTILLDDVQVGAGASVIHVMADYGVWIDEGENISGSPDQAVELLNEQAE